MNDFKISAVCITMNDGCYIEKSINSYKDIVDEIIVVDLGSTDNTIKICKELGCIIYSYNQNNNFSNAKNFALAKAKYPNILFLEPNEYFVNPLCDLDKDFFKQTFDNGAVGIKFLVKNIDIETNKNLYSNFGLKLYKSDINDYYTNSVYDIGFNSNNKLNTATNTDIVINHLKSSAEVSLERAGKDIELLSNIEEKSTMDYFYLSKNSLAIKDYESCIKYADMFFGRRDCRFYIENTDNAYLIYFYKYYAMKELKDVYSEKDVYDFLMNIENQLFDIPQTYYEIGLFYLDYNYAKAKNYFLKSIEMNNTFSIFSGKVNTYSSFESELYYLVSKIDYILGDNFSALKNSLIAAKLDVKNEKYYNNFLLCVSSESQRLIISFIEEVYQLDTKEDYDFILDGLSKRSLFIVLNYFLEGYSRKFNDNDNMAIYMDMMVNNKIELVRQMTLKNYQSTGNEDYLFYTVMSLVIREDIKAYNEYRELLTEDYKKVLDLFYIGTSKNRLMSYFTPKQKKIYFNMYVRFHALGESGDKLFDLGSFEQKDFVDFIDIILESDMIDLIFYIYKILFNTFGFTEITSKVVSDYLYYMVLMKECANLFDFIIVNKQHIPDNVIYRILSSITEIPCQYIGIYDSIMEELDICIE